MTRPAATEPTGSLEQALAQAARLLATDPERAGELAGEIIKAVGKHPVALLVLGVSRSALGNATQAIEILEPLARSQPNWAQAQMELGLALGRMGQGETAVASLRRALALKPDLPQAWHALGDHLSAIGDAAGADVAYANHVRHSTRDPDLMRAAAALYDNRLPEAETLLRAHLKAAPTDVAAIRMMAELAMRIGREEDAQNLLARCLELAPSFHAARQNYALVLFRSNKPAEALEQVHRLLAIDPRNPGYRNLEAVILSRIGDYEQAIAIYAEVLREYPNQAKVWLSYGHALKTDGRQDDSVAAYRKAIALEPGFGDAWWSLANLKTVRFAAEDIDAMRAQLARDDLNIEDRHNLEFALAKAFEDGGGYEASFAHYASGNALKRGIAPYDADDNARRLRRIREVCTREFFEQRKGYGASAADPIFIVGLPRAGSTLIEQILSSHSQVEGTMELPELISMSRALRQQQAGSQSAAAPYIDALAEIDAGKARALGERYLERTRIQRKTAAPFFIDKMPNNFVHIGMIQTMLPNAKIVDARRHPLACCFSGFKQNFARGQHFTYDLADIGRYYRDYVRLMAHFDDVLPGRVHRVIYEDMVADTEGQVRRLLAYCGLPFEEGCLRFFENERPVRTASSEQVRRPIYKEGVDHWRHFEPWLGPLKDALGPVLTEYPAVPSFAGED